MIGGVAASFLIVALSAFRLNPDREAGGPAGGSGGFQLVAGSDVPTADFLTAFYGTVIPAGIHCAPSIAVA